MVYFFLDGVKVGITPVKDSKRCVCSVDIVEEIFSKFKKFRFSIFRKYNWNFYLNGFEINVYLLDWGFKIFQD